MKTIRALAAMAIALAAIPTLSFAADSSPAPGKVTKFPFHGKIKSVDVSGNTFTVESKNPRVFNVTSTTKIQKNGQPATLKDAVAGDDTGGYAEKDASGKLTALSVRFGPKPNATPKPAKSAASSSSSSSGAAAASATPKAKKARKSKASASPSASPSAS